jgi:hypothetical protein
VSSFSKDNNSNNRLPKLNIKHNNTKKLPLLAAPGHDHYYLLTKKLCPAAAQYVLFFHIVAPIGSSSERATACWCCITENITKQKACQHCLLPLDIIIIFWQRMFEQHWLF